VHAPVVAGQPAGRHHEGGAAQVADILDRFAGGQAVRQVDQRPLGIAEDQHVGLGIGQDGTAHLVRPVIVMGDAAQDASMLPMTMGTSGYASRRAGRTR
jgi:hypothetical protein